MPYLAALMLFLAGGVGVSAAAQNALPGDLLYPVKVSVNEKVGASLAFSDEAKADYATSLADARLSEAESLAAEGKLSSEAESSLSAAFSAHADEAKADIAKLNESQDDDAAVSETKLNAVFAAHADIIAHVSGNASENATEKAHLMNAVSDAAESASAGGAVQAKATAAMAARPFAATASTNDSVQVSVHSKAAVLAMKQAASDSYEKANALVERYSAKLNADAKASAEASLSAAEALNAEGDKKLAIGDADSLEAAFANYRDALSATEELKLRVRASASGKAHVSVTPNILISIAASAPRSAGGVAAETDANADTNAGSSVSASIKATVRDILEMVSATSSVTSSSDIETDGSSSGNPSEDSTSANVSGSVKVDAQGVEVENQDSGSVQVNIGH